MGFIMNEQVIVNITEPEFNIKPEDKAIIEDKFHMGGGVWAYLLSCEKWSDPDDPDRHSFWFTQHEFKYLEDQHETV